MRQLVGQTCVRCGGRIAAEFDSRFCDRCGNPIHDRCRAPEAAPAPGGEAAPVEELRTCPACGADPRTKIAAEVRPPPPRLPEPPADPDDARRKRIARKREIEKWELMYAARRLRTLAVYLVCMAVLFLVLGAGIALKGRPGAWQVLVAAGVAAALAVPVWFLGSYAHRAVLMREKK